MGDGEWAMVKGEWAMVNGENYLAVVGLFDQQWRDQ